MKKAIFTLALALNFVIASASHESSILKVTVSPNRTFTASLDNRATMTSTFAQFDNVLAGSHELRIVGEVPYINPRAISAVRPANHGAQVAPVIFNGFVNIPENSIVDATIDNYGTFRIVSVTPLGNQYNAFQTGYGDDHHSDYGQGHHSDPDHDGDHDRDHHNGYDQTNYNNGYGYQYVPAPAMCPAEFDLLKQIIADKWFEDTKMEIAKQAIEKKGVTSQQVLELMNMMTFESSKMDLAKFAYNYTADKNNYFIVNNGFTFESSIAELNRYTHGSLF